MEVKEKIVSQFNKEAFVVEPMGVKDGIDPYIKDFITKLNESEDIMTIYSCEGHRRDDGAYLYFNVSEKGWDKFWLGVVPELSMIFLDDSKSDFGLYQTNWIVSTKSNEYNAGISIHSTLLTTREVAWYENKENFWKVMEEVFLKHF